MDWRSSLLFSSSLRVLKNKEWILNFINYFFWLYWNKHTIFFLMLSMWFLLLTLSLYFNRTHEEQKTDNYCYLLLKKSKYWQCLEKHTRIVCNCYTVELWALVHWNKKLARNKFSIFGVFDLNEAIVTVTVVQSR